MYTRPEGGLSIVVGAPKDGFLNQLRSMKKDELIQYFNREFEKLKINNEKTLANKQVFFQFCLDNYDAIMTGDKEDEFYKSFIMSSVPDDAINSREIPEEGIPSDRLFRDAWCDATPEPKVDFDMEKCKTIHMDRIRHMRNKKLSKLDVDLMIAQEQDKSSDVDTIKAEKQRLRDIPKNFDMTSASTPEQLKALWPENIDKHEIYQ